MRPPPAIEPVEFDGFVNFTVPPTTIGYDFSVSSGGSFTLTHLGVIDPDFDGLIDPVEVGIWDSFGNIVNSVILPQSPPPTDTDIAFQAFSAATPQPPAFGSAGAYFWSLLETPQILTPGSYTIGAYFSNQTYFDDGNENPELLDYSIFNVFQYGQQEGIAYGNNRLSFDEGFSRPTSSDPSDGCAYFGPIFAGTYSGAEVPSSRLENCQVTVEPPPPTGEGTEEDPFLPGEVNEDTGAFIFNFAEGQINVNDFFFFDPDIAIGYDYFIENALFAQVQAPTLPFDNTYNLFGSNDSCATFTDPLGTLTGGVTVTLSTPLECFRIDGIDVANMLDPDDVMAFVTGASITGITGNAITITQTPITTFVPSMEAVPAPFPVIGAGMALGWSRRLRRRVKQAGKYRL